jgi:hypothetical protein
MIAVEKRGEALPRGAEIFYRHAPEHRLEAVGQNEPADLKPSPCISRLL